MESPSVARRRRLCSVAITFILFSNIPLQTSAAAISIRAQTADTGYIDQSKDWAKGNPWIAGVIVVAALGLIYLVYRYIKRRKAKQAEKARTAVGLEAAKAQIDGYRTDAVIAQMEADELKRRHAVTDFGKLKKALMSRA